MKKPAYCTQNEGDCPTCSLVNYGHDCQNNPVDYAAFAARALGHKGGSVSSPAKSEAAKARNAARKAGAKPEGGRPRLNRYFVFFNNGDRKEVKAHDENEARDKSLRHCELATTSIAGVEEVKL